MDIVIVSISSNKIKFDLRLIELQGLLFYVYQWFLFKIIQRLSKHICFRAHYS